MKPASISDKMNDTRNTALRILFMAAILCGCSGDARLVLRLADWAGPDEMAIVDRALRRFEELHPEVRVVQESTSISYKEKILTSMASGTPPDVFLLDSIDVPAFVNRGLLLDLAPFAGRVGLDLSTFYPHVLAIAQRDGSLYAFPKDFTPMVLYYNKTFFDEAGVEYPRSNWTWEDFLQTCLKLRGDEDHDGKADRFATFVPRYFYLWQPWVWLNGGDVLSPDGAWASGYLNSPATQEALQFLVDLHIKYDVTPRLDIERYPPAHHRNQFYLGKIAMYESGHWWLPELRKFMAQRRLRIGVAPLPVATGKPRVNIMYESGWCVPSRAPHRQWSVRLAAFMAGEETQRMVAETGLAISAMRSVAEEIAAADTTGMERVFLEEAQYCRQPWGTVIEEFRTVQDVLQEVMDRMTWQQEDVATATVAVAQKIDIILADFRRTAEGRRLSPGAAQSQEGK